MQGHWSFPRCKKLALYCFEGGRGGGRVKGVFLILTVVHLSLDYVLYLCMSLLMWSDLSSMSVLNTNQSMRGTFSDNMQLPIGNEQICI